MSACDLPVTPEAVRQGLVLAALLGAGAVAAFAVAAWASLPLAWRCRVRRAVRAAWAWAASAEVRVPAVPCAVRSAAVRSVAVRAVELSPLLWRLAMRRRYAAARYTGVPQGAAWAAEAARLPPAYRAAVAREVRRYRPSAKLAWRAALLKGRRCAAVRAAAARLARVRHTGYALVRGGACADAAYPLDRWGEALAAFDARVAELVARGYEVRNLRRTTAGYGRYLCWA